MLKTFVLCLAVLLAACGAKPSPEPFPAPASTASSEIRRLPHPAVEALDTPSPLFRQAPAEQARAQIARMDKASMGLRSWMELAPALERSLAYARSWNPDERAAEHSGIRITWGEVVASLEKLKAILPRLDAQPELLEEGFQWLSVAPEVKFTGYYSPVMQASRTRKPGYEYPIYRLPEELAPDLAWCLPTHSCPEDAFLQVIKPEDPYYSRADIDLDGALKSRNLEMAWLEHPVETYDLMLEGSGILAFDDGTQQAALFAGLNGPEHGGLPDPFGGTSAQQGLDEGYPPMVGQPPPEAQGLFERFQRLRFFPVRCRASERDGGLRTDAVGQHGGRSARPAAWRHRFLRASGTAAGHPERARLRTRYRRRDPFAAHRHVHRGRRRRPPSGHDHLQSGAGLAVVGETVSLPEKVRFPSEGFQKAVAVPFQRPASCLDPFPSRKEPCTKHRDRGRQSPRSRCGSEVVEETFGVMVKRLAAYVPGCCGRRRTAPCGLRAL